MNKDGKDDIILLNTLESKGKPYKVFYHKDTLTWERTKSRKSHTKVSVPLSDIISVRLKDEKAVIIDGYGSSTVLSPTSSYQVHPSAPQSPFILSPGGSATINSYTFDGLTPSNALWNDDCREFTVFYVRETNDSKLRDHSITFSSPDNKIVRQWVTTLTRCLDELSRPRNLLLFINPFGGKQRALVVYEKYGKRLFRIANIEVLTVISQRANQITDTIWRQSLTGFDGIVCCGGDGTFAEIFNGLVFKALADRGDENVDHDHIPDIEIPIGMIPAGSTDTVAYCLHGTTDARTAILNIILGGRSGLDLSSVRSEQNESLIRVYSSILSYGYLGDIARESEKFRWMGPKRYEFAGIKQFLRNRGYHVEITYLDEPQIHNALKCERSCSRCLKAGANKLQSKDTPETETWRTIRGKYFMISAANIRCACKRSPNGIAPMCHLGDGYIDLILVKHTSFLNNIRLLLQLSKPDKSVEDLPFVDRIRTRKFRFKAIEPINLTVPDVGNSTQTIQSSSSRSEGRYESSFNCDGEILQDVNVKVISHCQLIQVFRRQSAVLD